MASNIEVASYDPKKVNLVMNGKIITSLPYVRSLALKRKEVSVMIVDANDSASVNVAEERCRVIKPPDITRAKEIGSESVSIFVPSLNYR